MQGSRQQGFTLTEMMAVIGVIGILLALGLPAFSDYLQNTHLRSATETLSARLEQAHNHAIHNRQDVYVILRPGENWCYGVSTSPNCDCNSPTTCDLGTESAPSNNKLMLFASGLNNNLVRFEKLRGMTDTNGELSFSIDSKTVTTKLTPSGQVSHCANTDIGYPSC